MLQHSIRRNKLLLISAVSLIIEVTVGHFAEEKLRNTLCHYHYDNDDVLPSIPQNFNLPAKSILFIETSCKGDLDSRQICSVESAANHNQDWKVNVLFAGPVHRKKFEGPGLAVLRGLKNVNFFRINVTDFAKNTPLQKIVARGALKRSIWKLSHTSDVLRALTLYKFGGVYLDLDVIVARPFSSLANNWAAREDSSTIGSAMLAFSRDKLGRKFSHECVNDLKKNYRGYIWVQNGPAVITRVLKKLCSTRTVEEMSAATCDGFEVYNPQLFYPVSWVNYSLYFKAEEILLLNPYTYHVWNKLSHGCTVHKDSPYAKLARAHCPATYIAFSHIFNNEHENCSR